MTLVFFLVAGLVLGALAERLAGLRSRKRIIGFTSLAVVMALFVGLVGGYLWANSVFNKVEKVEVSDQLSHGSGTNYLLVGSSKQNLRSVMVAVYELTGNNLINYQVLAAACMLVMLPVIVLFLAMRKSFFSAMVEGAVKG